MTFWFVFWTEKKEKAHYDSSYFTYNKSVSARTDAEFHLTALLQPFKNYKHNFILKISIFSSTVL